MEQEFVDMEVQQEAVSPETEPAGVNDAALAGRQEEQPREQSLEERAEFAAARRRAEAAFERKLQSERDRMDNYARMNGFASWEQMEQETSQAQLTEAGIRPEAIVPIVNQALSQHPAIKSAQEAQVQTAIEKSFSEFKANYPDSEIKSVEDFTQMENYDQFYRYICSGLDFSDAYMLANKDTIINKKTAAAKQAAFNAVNGKQHMRSNTGDADVETIHVPEETYQMYKSWFPDWSEKQIRAHYSKSQKG